MLTVVLLGLAFCHPAAAQVGSSRYSSIVIDAQTGNILSAINADDPRYPASLTKMMTIYMLFEALRDRRVTLDETVPVSPHAASMEPSKLGLVPGTYITVQQALLGLVTKSANDAASALGELLGGDEDQFAQMMTLRARALGMSHTTFRNASGLPNMEQTTTAHDLAILARHLIQDYPSEYRYFSTPSFVFHGRTILNHDRMLQTYPGADGLKTGYTDASGCNLVTSAVHGGVRLIGVVMGASNGGERDANMASILDAGFTQEGVAPELIPHHPHFPALVAAADAAPLPPRLRYRAARYAALHHGAPEVRPAIHTVAARGPNLRFGPHMLPRVRQASARMAVPARVTAHTRRQPAAALRQRPHATPVRFRAARPAPVVRHVAATGNRQYASRTRG